MNATDQEFLDSSRSTILRETAAEYSKAEKGVLVDQNLKYKGLCLLVFCNQVKCLIPNRIQIVINNLCFDLE